MAFRFQSVPNLLGLNSELSNFERTTPLCRSLTVLTGSCVYKVVSPNQRQISSLLKSTLSVSFFVFYLLFG